MSKFISDEISIFEAEMFFSRSDTFRSKRKQLFKMKKNIDGANQKTLSIFGCVKMLPWEIVQHYTSVRPLTTHPRQQA